MLKKEYRQGFEIYICERKEQAILFAVRLIICQLSEEKCEIRAHSKKANNGKLYF